MSMSMYVVAINKRRRRRDYLKNPLSPILCEPFKDSEPPRPAIGDSETNSQYRNEGFWRGTPSCPLLLLAFSPFFVKSLGASTLANWSNARHRSNIRAPSPQMYVSKVWKSVWPEGAGSDS
jgi:hypothetical protein